MHNINKFQLTPYERVAKAMTFMVKEFDEDGIIPCFVFGESRTQDTKILPLSFNAPTPNIQGMDNVLAEYRKACLKIAMHGPTTLAPVINETI